METELKELQKEEDEIYEKLKEFSNPLKDKKKQKIFGLLSELIEVNIELEKHCNQ